jgi:dTDP-4-amino-4,6-dideoxygalactose transaminase
MSLHVTAVPFFRHDLSAQDASAIASVLNTPMLTSGAVGRKVEAQISTFFGVPGALLTNSWTNGALTALFALGIGRGDEVIVPAMTFISSANVIEMVGATPIFVDVDSETLLMQPEQMCAAVTPRTKAILPVHLYGQLCDVAALRAAIAHRPEIRIIEDAAHCFEGSRNGHRPAAFGDMAVFSFYATKNVTCGEGGAIAVRDGALLAALTQARLHGMTADAIDRYRNNRYRHWDMVRLGCKGNLPDLLAALLPSQIEKVEAKLLMRRRVADVYRAAFADGPVRMPRQLDNAVSAEHAFAIHVPPAVRDDAIEALNATGIGVGVHFRSVPSTTYYRERYGFKAGQFPISDAWGAGTISLPLYPSISDDEQRYVIDAVRKHVYPLCQLAND